MRSKGLTEGMSKDARSYYHVVWSYKRSYDIGYLTEELQKNKFTLVKTLVSERNSVFRELLPEILFKADTLYVAVSPKRAILFQKEDKPFTGTYLKMLKKILALYPNRRLPFFTKEPTFEIQGD
jgi:hypothetical protein